MVRDVAEPILPGEHQRGTVRRDLARGQDEIDSVRPRPRRKVLGPERRRARAPERVGQPGGRRELTEQGALAAEVEIAAHHGARPGFAHDLGEHAELGAVQRVIPVRLGPVTVMVGHRMSIDHVQLRPSQPGYQGPCPPSPETGRTGQAGSLGRPAETPEPRAGHRPPGERDHAASRPGRPARVAHLPERTHPPHQLPQVPVREHLLAADHVRVPGIEPGADHGQPRRQLRARQGNAPGIERSDDQQLTGHASHPSGAHHPPGTTQNL